MEMVEVRTEALTGAALNWAVAKAQGYIPSVIRAHTDQGETVYSIGLPTMSIKRMHDEWNPSTDWSQAGPLIEKYDVSISHACTGYWASAQIGIRANGDTRLIAACRAIVAARLGDTVQVPAELTR